MIVDDLAAWARVERAYQGNGDLQLFIVNL